MDARCLLLGFLARLEGHTPMSPSLAEHLRDTEEWWLNVHGRDNPEEREWCRWVAYERWLNGKALLSVADPQPSWWEKQESEQADRETERS